MHPSVLWSMGPMMIMAWSMPVLIVMVTYRSPWDE